MKGDLAWAPISEPANVLDIGTGTGIWAVEFADSNPKSNVIGTDLSLIQPQNIPPNCQFFREDAEENWVFDFPFDYIHLRFMTSCFDDPKGMVKKIFDHLRPGGWIEYQQIAVDEASELAIQNNPRSFREYMRRLVRGAASFGRDIDLARKYKYWIIEAGFVDVVERQILGPVNPWAIDPKDNQIGRYSQANFTETTYSSAKFLKATGMTEPEIEYFLDGVRRNIADTSVHSYAPWYVIYGRKPYQEDLVNAKAAKEQDPVIKPDYTSRGPDST
ncbi:S-adenosyl-L-methionine-dependent methyltransferase [Pseudomassariella vexata]|uniref:S-adenosyl-L-methionine-dependent methyltransferase n=1 Tax=Pseudomassariella vexata TaxID=1141098 RepID=A0A1Y2EBZ7_9PEZI|nr:S-adenosyl-L-methionine-dependent methyltransferase [Pseudomassariella vexata]ORY69062.1 S-adenosyl-L-methionine-dependent methyltransferase [Pseudomassariella vexata]